MSRCRTVHHDDEDLVDETLHDPLPSVGDERGQRLERLGLARGRTSGRTAMTTTRERRIAHDGLRHPDATA